jgi:heat shock protein HslJ
VTQTRVIVLAWLALTAMGACGSSDDSDEAAATAAAAPTTTATTGSLEGATWELIEGGTMDVPLEAVTVTARFEDGRVSGTSGCNAYTSTYELDGSSLTIGPDIASTLTACPAAETAVETAYLERLTMVTAYTIDGGTLALADADGATLLQFEATTADGILGSWTATSFYTGDAVASPVGDVTLTATFEEDSISGNTGCNSFTGPYRVDGDSIGIGPLASTRAACPTEELQVQEQKYLAALELATTYAVTGEQLDLFRPGGTFAATFTRA